VKSTAFNDRARVVERGDATRSEAIGRRRRSPRPAGTRAKRRAGATTDSVDRESNERELD
jgi:hypothetical protein